MIDLWKKEIMSKLGWASPLPPVPMRSGAPEYGTEPEVEGELEKAGWQGDNDGDDCSNIGLCLARLGQQAMLRQARQAPYSIICWRIGINLLEFYWVRCQSSIRRHVSSSS